MKMRVALGVVLGFVMAGQVLAEVSLVSGPGTPVANPNNQRYYADPYNTDTVFYWPERSGVMLGSDLVVSILPPASFPTDSTSHSNDNSLTIPSGTTVNSYLLNYDPQSGSAVATFSFDETIIGLITNSRDTAANDHFMLSDFLINPLVPSGNLSATHYDARGIEPDSGDYVHWLSASEIEIHVTASSPGDQIRVITSAPEPKLSGVAGLVLVVMISRRWRMPIPARIA